MPPTNPVDCPIGLVVQCQEDRGSHSGSDIPSFIPCTRCKRASSSYIGVVLLSIGQHVLCMPVLFYRGRSIDRDISGQRLVAYEFYQALFNAQTITTVGYGQVHPATNLTNLLAALESFTGNPDICIDHGADLCPFFPTRAYPSIPVTMRSFLPHRDHRHMMFRLASYKNNNLTNVTAQVILALHERTMNGRSPNSIT